MRLTVPAGTAPPTPRNVVEIIPHGRHPRLDDLRLQVRREARDLDRDVVDRGVTPLGRELIEPPPRRDELADQVHQPIQPAEVDAQVTAARGLDRGARSGGPRRPAPPL